MSKPDKAAMSTWRILTRRAFTIPDLVGDRTAGRAVRGRLYVEFGDVEGTTHEEKNHYAERVLKAVTELGSEGNLDQWLLPTELAAGFNEQDGDSPEVMIRSRVLGRHDADGERGAGVDRMALLVRDRIRTYIAAHPLAGGDAEPTTEAPIV